MRKKAAAKPEPKPEPVHRGGRKTVWTPKKIEEILGYIRTGVPYVFAFRAAGIGESTFYEKKAGDPEFAEALEKAEAECVAENVAIIKKAAITNWTAAAWTLERRYPDLFGRKFDVGLKAPDESTFDEADARKVAKAFLKRRDGDTDTVH